CRNGDYAGDRGATFSHQARFFCENRSARLLVVRSCGQERGNDIGTMAAGMLLHRVKVLPCVRREQLHAFSLVTSCKYPFPYQASI
ncbi:unnamed protein product, partial [Ascophyllum nodosum]